MKREAKSFDFLREESFKRREQHSKQGIACEEL